MTSIIIVSYNTCSLLRQCLLSVREHCPDAQVVVVDNASRDGSVGMVQEEFPEVQVVALSTNLGFAAGNNAGLPLATGRYVVLLNSDTVLRDDSLQRCVAFLQTHPRVGAVSPHLLGVDGVPQRCLYPFPSLREKLRQALRRTPEPDTATGWLAGTTLVLRREALQAINGLLDDAFFMYWEDADLSARLLEAGWTIAVCPDACILHYGGASGGGPDALRRPDLHAWYTYGEHRWFAKHRPGWEVAAYWLLDFVDVFRRYGRGLLRQGRQGDRQHARTVAGVLGGRLFGLKPARPRPAGGQQQLAAGRCS